jgi:voltage-gated potassium channel Kch
MARVLALLAKPRRRIPVDKDVDSGQGPRALGGKTSYELFIGVMTIMSLLLAASLVVDWINPISVHNTPTQILYILLAMDLLLCGLFLLDFARALIVAPNKVAYVFGERPGRSLPYGILELIGAIPILFVLRFFRVVRLMRAGWTMSDLKPPALARAVLASRAGSAVYLTMIVTFIVLLFGSIAVLWFELHDPEANIASSTDALWWAFVTITTVGYGDQFPVSGGGRVVAVTTMIVGIGIFGVIAGFLASFLTAHEDEDQGGNGGAGVDQAGSIASELAALHTEVAELRRSIESARANE